MSSGPQGKCGMYISVCHILYLFNLPVTTKVIREENIIHVLCASVTHKNCAVETVV